MDFRREGFRCWMNLPRKKVEAADEEVGINVARAATAKKV